MRNSKGQFIKGFHPTTQFKKGDISLNKGKKASLETKEKQRKAKLKNPTRYWLGKKRTEMIGNKNGVGTKHTLEWKQRNSERFKGAKNPSWKGGITPLNHAIRDSFNMRQWRSDVFTRDNFYCQICGQHGGELHADHIKLFSVIMEENKINTFEKSLICEELWNINNGRTLCKKCHLKRHRKAVTYNVEGAIIKIA